jgi:RNA polymerase sigma factor (sigma-70 family)
MYNHELAEQVRRQGEPLTAEENLAIYVLVRAGDTAARERMITGNMPLVIEHVNNFIQDGRTWLGHFRDDLTSAGFLGLVGAVNNLVKRKKPVEDPNAYLICAIWAKLFDAIGQDQNVGRSRSGGRARRDENWVLPTTVSMDMEKLPVSSEIRAVDLRDFIEACCHNDTERQFIRLVEEGYTFVEIASITGVHETTVGRAIHRIEAQVKQEWHQ